MASNGEMTGAVLPGNSTVELRRYPVPRPGSGQVLLRMKASSLCGSDIRAIYREHLGVGAEKYQGVIAGHEPCGQVEATGSGCRRFGVGDRVIVYHISGCGFCHDCRMGYQISCTGEERAAYGWQRDGGHAEYLLAEEDDLVALPDELSYADGALIACGFGTAYEALVRAEVSGGDTVLVTGLGPVGLATMMLARALGAPKIVGTDIEPGRVALAGELGLADALVQAGRDGPDDLARVLGAEGAEVTIDTTGSAAGRLTALEATRRRGRCVFVGEGGTVTFQPSRDLIHRQLTLHGSWVTSLPHMEDLTENLVRWKVHPDRIVTHRFALDEVAQAYQTMDEGRCGKVVVETD